MQGRMEELQFRVVWWLSLPGGESCIEVKGRSLDAKSRVRPCPHGILAVNSAAVLHDY